MANVGWDDAAYSLRRDGFCRLPAVLDDDLVTRLRQAADARGERRAERMGEAYRAQGSMVGLSHLRDPVFGEAVVHPGALAALSRLGLTGTTFTDA